MKTQQPVPVVDADYMLRIFKSKHLAARAVLLLAHPTVTARCTTYTNTLPTLASFAKHTWTTDVHDALISCYDSKTQELSKLKDAILDALRLSNESDLQRCPYCMLDEPSTWDHYLPKTYYPEYSVFDRNLVYVCSRCNHKKWEHFSATNLLYCHPYFTVHPTEPVLHCNISIADQNLKIQYYVAGNGAIAPYVEIANEHMERLELAKRFNSAAASVVSMFVAELRQMHSTGLSVQVLKDILQSRYQAVNVDFGPNAWEARLWNALGTCPDFLGYVKTQIASTKHPFREGFETIAPPF